MPPGRQNRELGLRANEEIRRSIAFRSNMRQFKILKLFIIAWLETAPGVGQFGCIYADVLN